MSNTILTDPFEMELESLIATTQLVQTIDLEQRKDYHQKIAEASIQARKQKRLISLRVAGSDIDVIKKKSEFYGVSYQTLLNILIRNFVHGKTQLVLD